MRILAVNYEYPPLGGGGGVVFQQIVETLAQRHEITVLTTAFTGFPGQERSGRLEIVRVPVLGRSQRSTATLPSMLSYFPSSWWTGRRLLGRGGFDLINSHFVVPSAPSAHLLAGAFHLPHVLSIHGGDLYDPSKKLSPHRVPVLRGTVGRLLRSADRIVAQSRNTAENARRIYGIDRPIEIIPLGIRRPVYAKATRRELGIEEDRFVLVTVGRLIARKGLPDLLHALAELGDPRALLLVLGEGPLRASLEQLARDLGIAGRVRFCGRVEEEEKWRLLDASDLYASTSLHEGFGLVYLEAFECGLPVVTYDNGGQTDFVEDGVCGRLIRLGDRTGFVEALRFYLRDPAARALCAANNRERVTHYYIERCAESYEALFEEVLRTAQPQRGPRASSKVS